MVLFNFELYIFKYIYTNAVRFISDRRSLSRILSISILSSHFNKDESFENVVLRRGLNTQVNLLDDTSFENTACCSQRCASTLNRYVRNR